MEEDMAMSGADLGALVAINLIVDLLVTANPTMNLPLQQRLQSKIADLAASPEHAPAVTYLQMVLDGLLRSARALHRGGVQGNS